MTTILAKSHHLWFVEQKFHDGSAWRPIFGAPEKTKKDARNTLHDLEAFHTFGQFRIRKYVRQE